MGILSRLKKRWLAKGWTQVTDRLPEPGHAVLGVVHRNWPPLSEKIVVDVDTVELIVAVDEQGGGLGYKWVDSSGEEPDLGVSHWRKPPKLPRDMDFPAYHRAMQTQPIDIILHDGRHYRMVWNEAREVYEQFKQNDDGEWEPNDDDVEGAMAGG